MDSITTLHNELREAALDLAWGQWTAAGVAGTRETSTSLIDPEALRRRLSAASTAGPGKARSASTGRRR